VGLEVQGAIILDPDHRYQLLCGCMMLLAATAARIRLCRPPEPTTRATGG